MAAVWPGTVVEDNNLTVQISALRRILDQGQPEASCIQTVAGLRSPKPPLMCGRGGAGPRRCGSRRRAV
jgi:hypothetical protein